MELFYLQPQLRQVAVVVDQVIGFDAQSFAARYLDIRPPALTRITLGFYAYMDWPEARPPHKKNIGGGHLARPESGDVARMPRAIRRSIDTGKLSH